MQKGKASVVHKWKVKSVLCVLSEVAFVTLHGLVR